MLFKYIAVLILVGVTVCYAQLSRQPAFIPQSFTVQDEQAARNRIWANLPWTGNNAPYQQVRQQMESDDTDGQDMDALRLKFALLAQQHPKDPLAQFRWAYAATLSISPTTDGGTARNRIFGVAEALTRVPLPILMTTYANNF